MRIIVTGSRTWDQPEVIWDCLDIIAREAFRVGDESFTVVHGCAKGADTITDGWACERRRLWPVTVERHPADWATHGRRAGFLRNQEMASLGADLCLAFTRGNSRGTAQMIRLAEEHGIPTKVVEYPELPPREVA